MKSAIYCKNVILGASAMDKKESEETMQELLCYDGESSPKETNLFFRVDCKNHKQ